MLYIVMPAYNEKECIAEAVAPWLAILTKIPGKLLVVNDGSKDGTGDILDQLAAANPSLEVVHQTNAGHGAAVLNGYRKAVEAGAEYVFQTDSDNQFDVETDFWKLWNDRELSPFIQGNRFPRHDPKLRILISKFARFLILALFGRLPQDANIPFRLMHGVLLRELLAWLPKNVFAPNLFITALALAAKMRIRVIPVKHLARTKGAQKLLGFRMLGSCIRCFFELLRFRLHIRSTSAELREIAKITSEATANSLNHPGAPIPISRGSKEIQVEYLILGAGPTGLGAAYRLKELGISDFLIVDADNQVGGLAKSIRDPQGFTWDIGGHVQFSHYPYFDEVMHKAIAPKEWLSHQRESWVWMRDRFVPYPFQNNLRYLPASDLWKCLEGIINAEGRNPNEKPKNFYEWIHATFGQGIAETFLEPYNFKVWATPLEEMSYQWIGERVSVVDLKRSLSNVILGKDDVSWGPNNKFGFPKQGGTGAIWTAVADLIGNEHIRLHTRVERVQPGLRRVICNDGTAIRFKHCLSTLPLDHLTHLMEGLDPKVREEAGKLRHSSTNVVGIGIEGPMPKDLATKCWMYFPEENCPFYRATVFSNYSPNNVPDASRQYSLMLEVSESGFKAVDSATLIQKVIEGLWATKLIETGSQIISQWSIRAPYGYPTPTVTRDAILAKVHPEIEKYQIYSRGRFGGWKYEVSNQDHSMMQGVEWANRMVKGEAEITYFGKDAAPVKVKKAA